MAIQAKKKKTKKTIRKPPPTGVRQDSKRLML